MFGQKGRPIKKIKNSKPFYNTRTIATSPQKKETLILTVDLKLQIPHITQDLRFKNQIESLKYNRETRKTSGIHAKKQ